MRAVKEFKFLILGYMLRGERFFIVNWQNKQKSDKHRERERERRESLFQFFC